MHGFHRTFGVFHKISRKGSGREITLTDVFLLHFIGSQGEQTPKDIAAYTGLTSGSVTSMLDRLERAGFVRRARSTLDRRVVLVRLTPKTRETLLKAMERAHVDTNHLFERWTTEEIETFATLLEKFGSVDFEP